METSVHIQIKLLSSMICNMHGRLHPLNLSIEARGSPGEKRDCGDGETGGKRGTGTGTQGVKAGRGRHCNK